MHPIVDNILERPLSHKIGIWAGSLLFLTFVFWQYFYKSQFEKRTELEDKIGSLRIQTLEQQRIASNLPKFREETKKYDKLLERVVLELPDKKEIQSLLNSISVLAVDTGLEVTKFAPEAEEIRDFIVAIPVFIELEGSYHQLATFFDEVGHLSRIVNIDKISVDIITETPTEVVVRASCNATAFRYAEESELAPEQPAGNDTRGGKKRRVA